MAGIIVLVTSLTVCVVGFAMFAYAAWGLLERSWDYRRAMVVTMPFGVAAGVMGAGGIILAGNRFTARRGSRRKWAAAGATTGLLVAVFFYFALGIPSEADELWFPAASAASGASSRLVAWWYARKTAEA